MPSTNKDLDKVLIDRLLELMVIRAAIVADYPDAELKELDNAIIRAKAPMSEEQIAWVEKLVKQYK